MKKIIILLLVSVLYSCGVQIQENKTLPTINLKVVGFNYDNNQYKIGIASDDGKCTNKIDTWQANIVINDINEVQFTYSANGWSKKDLGGHGFAPFINISNDSIILDKMTPKATKISFNTQKTYINNECDPVSSSVSQTFDFLITALGIDLTNDSYNSPDYSADLVNMFGAPSNLATEVSNLTYSINNNPLVLTNPIYLVAGTDFPENVPVVERISGDLTASTPAIDLTTFTPKPMPAAFIGQNAIFVGNYHFNSSVNEMSEIGWTAPAVNNTLYCANFDYVLWRGGSYFASTTITAVEFWYQEVGNPASRVTRSIPVTGGTNFSVSQCDVYGTGKLQGGLIVHYSNGLIGEGSGFAQWY